jgi:TonB family protein
MAELVNRYRVHADWPVASRPYLAAAAAGFLALLIVLLTNWVQTATSARDTGLRELAARAMSADGALSPVLFARARVDVVDTAISADGRYVAQSDVYGNIALLDLQTGATRTLDAPAVASDLNIVAVGDDATLLVFLVATSAQVGVGFWRGDISRARMRLTEGSTDAMGAPVIAIPSDTGIAIASKLGDVSQIDFYGADALIAYAEGGAQDANAQTTAEIPGAFIITALAGRGSFWIAGLSDGRVAQITSAQGDVALDPNGLHGAAVRHLQITGPDDNMRVVAIHEDGVVREAVVRDDGLVWRRRTMLAALDIRSQRNSSDSWGEDRGLILDGSRVTFSAMPGAVFRDCAFCPQMVVAGNGAIGRFPVTRAEYALFADETQRGDGSCDSRRVDLSWRNPGFEQGGRHPAVCISWNDAEAYVAWLTERTGRTYRLPTVSELNNLPGGSGALAANGVGAPIEFAFSTRAVGLGQSSAVLFDRGSIDEHVAGCISISDQERGRDDLCNGAYLLRAGLLQPRESSATMQTSGFRVATDFTPQGSGGGRSTWSEPPASAQQRLEALRDETPLEASPRPAEEVVAPTPTTAPDQSPTIVEPRITSMPSGSELEAALPIVTRRVEYSGSAAVRCRVLANGALRECAVISETPPRQGFGQAALTLVRRVNVSPQTVDGQATDQGMIDIPFRFEGPERSDVGRRSRPD